MRILIFFISLILSFFLLGIFTPTSGQVFKDDNVIDILNKKAKEENIILYFDPEWFRTVKLPESLQNNSLIDILQQLLPEIGLGTISYPPNYIIIVNEYCRTGKQAIPQRACFGTRKHTKKCLFTFKCDSKFISDSQIGNPN